MRIKLLPISSLRPTEETDPEQIAWLLEEIPRCGAWIRPICVEAEHLVIMDGHHRYAVAGLLGLKRVPCVTYNYADVKVESRRAEFSIVPENIIHRGLKQDLFPAKTTKHHFPEEIVCDISLDELIA
jgi:ParB-like chromosome segregation protein Spo0J